MRALIPIGSFEDTARELLGDDGFDRLLEDLARTPTAGQLIRGTGGLRKYRVARPGSGKRGGARVIYYAHNAHTPILLLAVYAKAEHEDLTDRQAARLRKLVDELIDALG